MNAIPTTHLLCAYLPAGDLSDALHRTDGGVLGALCFSGDAGTAAATASTAPVMQVPMPAIDAGIRSGACEIWASGGEFAHGMHHGVHYGHNDSILFGAIQLDEAQFDADTARGAGKTPLQQAAETAYRALFDVTGTLNFPHILRIWNYIANINGDSHGMERYRQFNMGRHDGFLASGRQVLDGVPAASAVGFREGPLTIYFLAARDTVPVAIENPRQVSAYRYPQEYGPRSPTFSRASVARLGSDDVLFLSGTASIVGHRTLHAGDVVAQTRETLANIAALVAEANRVAPQAGFSLQDLCYKVYVRHETDVDAIQRELRQILGESAALMFLRADICRADLLMEIEATAGHPLEFEIPQSCT